MIRGKFVWDEEEKKLVRLEDKKKKEVDAPYVIPDEIPGGLESMVTGKIHTSKAELRAEYKRHGVQEKGNDRHYVKPGGWQDGNYEQKLREDAERVWYELRDNMCESMTELDRERCKRQDHYRENYNYDRRDVGPDGKPRE